MQIMEYWRVTQIVRDMPSDRGFSTIVMNYLLESLFGITRNAGLTLNLMQCVKKVHTGSLGGQGESRDPNIYLREVTPEDHCDDCPLSTCMIRHKKMAVQVGLDEKIEIPFDRLVILQGETL